MQPIDLNKTPAKSILKAPGSSKVHRKSVKIISANNSPMKGRTSFINSFENLQLETDSKNYEELVKSIKEKENSPAKSRKTRKIKRNPSLNLISFDSPERRNYPCTS